MVLSPDPGPEPSPFEGRSPVASLAQPSSLVTLVEGQTFCLSAGNGDIVEGLPHGLFLADTRVLSSCELRVDGDPVEPLTAEISDPFMATFVGRARPPAGRADAELVVFRDRAVGSGMRELVKVVNYGMEPADVTVELLCDVDFADLFAVKENRVRRVRGLAPEVTPGGLRFAHDNGRVTKQVEVCGHGDFTAEAGVLRWTFTLGPGAEREVCAEIIATFGAERVEPRFRCGVPDVESLPSRRLATWRATLPGVDSDHDGLSAAVHRAGEDLGALRIFDPDHPDVPILAAGAPWFMTVFGRDSLLTAWMTLIADPSLAQGVLETLARFQGDDVNPATEEEPGKILHEMRFGALGGLSLGGGDVYYGSIDATPLFVMLLGELHRWSADTEATSRLLPYADRALEWIDSFGDRDGDGYVEYVRQSERGLANQGWKDSWDAVRHRDGALAEAPIALCEVQGYVYSAYQARAHFAEDAGDVATAEHYWNKAADLRRRFNEDFWVDELGCYALGLDADKRPVATLASNVGHCLWTGIVDEERAGEVARRLMSDEMFSGWGVRTLGSSMAAYNPVSYHNGSVWPHDNALCAAGLARYGFIEEAHRIIEAQIDVAQAYRGRLPELFAGFQRGRPHVPAAYPTSCSPQAWAAAAPLLWLRTMLRFDPDPNGRVFLEPVLPSWLEYLRVDGIGVAGWELSVNVEDDLVEVSGNGPLDVVRRARPSVGPR